MFRQPTYRSYRALNRFGAGRVFAAMLLDRTAGTMWTIVLVLLVLDRFHSTGLAGLAVLLSTGPALLLSPVAGAFLDRHRRRDLIVFDYVLAGASLGLIAVLSLTGRLSIPLMLGLVVMGGITTPLSETGLRSMLPLMVPPFLWDKANLIDGGLYVVATLLGPALGGTAVGVLGWEPATFVVAGVFAVGAMVAAGVEEPSIPLSALSAGRRPSMLAEAGRGVLYVLRNRTLRGLAMVITINNLATGTLDIAIPLLVIGRLKIGVGATGLLFGVLGIAGIVSAVITGAIGGRVSSEGYERLFLAIGTVGMATGMVVLARSDSLTTAAAAMALIGATTSPLNIALAGLRMRRTDRAWLGRAFAVSAAVNGAGLPLGTALAGTVAAMTLSATFYGAAIASGVATLLIITIPRR